MSDPPRNRHGEEGETPLPIRPAQLVEDGSGELDGDDGDVDSEPRRKWTPNPELLRALADARRDLKPGEASLFWDWTATRDSAPPAENLRPSGEGEVLVSDKDAASAYVPPVTVEPAKPPRSATKSRVRVRADVDPRKQPTVKTARASDPKGPPVAAFRDATDSHPPASGPVRASRPSHSGEARASHPEDGREGGGRRKLVLLALGLGCFTGILVFFWLHAPSPPRPEQAPFRSLPSAAPQESSSPAGPAASPPSDEGPRAPLSPAPPEPRSVIVSQQSVSSIGAASTLVDRRPRERETRKGASAVATAAASAGAPPAPHDSPAPAPEPTDPASSASDDFLIRKKGTN